MWGGIVALHGRYSDVLAWLKDGWWKSQTHVEMLCALVVWRQELDDAGRDPRDEIAFQHTRIDYGHILRQEGGSITQAWTPGVAPDEWRQQGAGGQGTRGHKQHQRRESGCCCSYLDRSTLIAWRTCESESKMHGCCGTQGDKRGRFSSRSSQWPLARGRSILDPLGTVGP